MTPIEGQPGGPVPTTSPVVSWILNPDLVAAHAQERVEKPKVTQAALEAFHGLKPGVPVDKDQHALIMKGVNAGVHAGFVNLKGTNHWLPVLVKVHVEEPQAAAPKQTVPPPEVGKPKSFAALQQAILGDVHMYFEQPDDQGRTPCVVMTNAAPKLCVCGGWHDPSEMRAVRIGEKACLPVGQACAQKMRKLTYDQKNFAEVLAEVLGFKKLTAPKKLAGPPSTLEQFVEAVIKGRWLQFSKESKERKGFFLCTLAVNGDGLCDCEAHARNLYALKDNGKVFPICPACAGKLRLLDPKLDISDTSFAQALGWREDLFPVGKYNPDHKPTSDVRAGVQINANGVVSLAQRPKTPKKEEITHDELKKREAANAARRAEHKAKRQARSAAAANKPTTPPKAKNGGKKAQGRKN